MKSKTAAKKALNVKHGKNSNPKRAARRVAPPLKRGLAVDPLDALGVKLFPEERTEVDRLRGEGMKLPQLLTVALKVLVAQEKARRGALLVRPRLMDKTLARLYAVKVADALKTGAPWVGVEFDTQGVTTHDAHPGNAKGHVYLRNTEPDAWKAEDGTLTPKSVLACLLGLARPATGGEL